MKTVVTFTIDHDDMNQAEKKDLDLWVTEASLQTDAAYAYEILNHAACGGLAKTKVEVVN